MKNKLFSAARLFLMIVILIVTFSVNITPQPKKVVVRHGPKYREVIVKDRHYFYHRGYFYDKRPTGYVKIVAPVGARLSVLPRGYKVVYVRKAKYFLFGDVYYSFLPNEKVYVVIEKPL